MQTIVSSTQSSSVLKLFELQSSAERHYREHEVHESAQPGQLFRPMNSGECRSQAGNLKLLSVTSERFESNRRSLGIAQIKTEYH